MLIPQLAEFKKLFDQEMQGFLQGESDYAKNIDPSALDLIEKTTEFTQRGGKKIRPALLYFTYQCFSDSHLNDVLHASLSVELMETSLLMLDDIMDNATQRRGKETVHLIFAKENPRLTNYGSSAAILTGVLSSYLGIKAIHQTSFSPSIVNEAINSYRQVMLDECFGQNMDLLSQANQKIDQDLNAKINYFKTTRYTLDCPLEIAAALAQTNASDRARLKRIAHLMGEAFQLQDDILGAFGDEKQLGKSAMSDFVEGKRTLLIIKALEKATPAQKQLIESSLGNPDLTPIQANDLREVIRTTGGLSFAQDQAKSAIAKARQLLKEAAWRREGTDFVCAVADFIVERTY